MKLKLSKIYLGFQNKTFKILSKDLAERGNVFKKEIIIAKLSLTKEKGYFYLNGNLEATLEYTCVRCLKKNPKKIDLPINILLFEETMNYTTKTDCDIIYFKKSNDYINLKNIFADLIALAEPYQPLCDKKCKGLCPKCGIEKINFCNCIDRMDTTAWQKLKDLYIQ